MFMTIEPFCPKIVLKNFGFNAEVESEIFQNHVNPDFDEVKSLNNTTKASATESP